jgi:Undecaprenyl-phosphate glucose phosphotransferase
MPGTIFAGLVRASDFCILVAVGIAAGFGFRTPLGAELPMTFLASIVIAALAASYCLNRFNAYGIADLCSGRPPLHGGALSLLAGTAVFGAGAMALIGVSADTAWPLAALAAAWFWINGVLLGLTRVGVFHLARHLRRSGQLGSRVALLGSPASAASFMAMADHAGPHMLQVVGLYRDNPGDGETGPANIPNLGTPGELVADGQRGKVDVVVITLPSRERARMERILVALRPLATDIYAADAAGAAEPIAELGGLKLAVVARAPLSPWQRVRKRTIDIVGSAMLLAFLAPVLLLIALLVKVDSTGPVLFRQTRIGYLNQPFTCLKFRSMFDHVADLLADRQTTRDDPRVTRVGKWLRRTSLDELPQLVNVLLGDMSLVGPRPHAPHPRAGGRFFAEVVSDYALRHRVKPGMTGWAQVNGWRGETATVLQIEERVRHDLYYIRHWSLVFDIRILLMTATRGFLGKQTY